MWSDLMEPWAPAPDDELRIDLLAACAYAALAARPCLDPDCKDCGDEPCRDHAGDAALAARFERVYTRVAMGSAAWCDLAVKLISEMN